MTKNLKLNFILKIAEDSLLSKSLNIVFGVNAKSALQVKNIP